MYRHWASRLSITLAAVALLAGAALAAPAEGGCARVVTADVVALDQAFFANRQGALQPGGMIFALRHDVVPQNDPADLSGENLQAGSVMLRPDKRPRPIVLRMNEGDCLEIRFQNLLADFQTSYNPDLWAPTKPDHPVDPGANPMVRSFPDPNNPNNNRLSGMSADPGGTSLAQTTTRWAGVHVMGLQPVETIDDDGSWVGANDIFAGQNPTRRSGLVAPGQRITYRLYAEGEGAFLLYSTGADSGANGAYGGQISEGLFGSVTVQPATAEYYRSQVTYDDLRLAAYSETDLPPGGRLECEGGSNDCILIITQGQTSRSVPVAKASDGRLETPAGQPLVNYHALYPPGHARACIPILAMAAPSSSVEGGACQPDGDSGLQLYHSDLTAIITGPGAGRFAYSDDQPVFNENYAEPDRRQPYRELVQHYHDNFLVAQSFAAFRGQGPDADLNYTLEAGRDNFAINYGMGAIGPPIYGNRIGTGPMTRCVTCKFEEFFLSSWPLGDPAMVVDFPANTVKAEDLASGNCTDPSNPATCQASPGRKATKAFYPDDPSNVYHSYMRDHVKFRILHAGTNITHVHHQHAHQWLHSPNANSSHYRDSQMITPAATWTLEMVYNGSGNVNQTVGDSIFHCHFYPHFAEGMWGLWRVHDVFEEGTRLDEDGVAESGWNRALPDGEIAQGTPTPAVVPVPTLPMAPMPARTQVCAVYSPEDVSQMVGDTCPQGSGDPLGFIAQINQQDIDQGLNPGFPFFIPGVAGQRAPHPPLDFAWETDANGDPVLDENGNKIYLDGGLPRHLVVDWVDKEQDVYEKHNRWDFTKEVDRQKVVQLPEDGTEVEKVAMTAHSQRAHRSFTPEGAAGNFILNGLPPKAGAPYADPGITPLGLPVDDVRRYKAANIELDLVLNKKGWHYPQMRILTLWGDVKDTIEGKRAAEPFFFRANSGEVVEYWHTNLVPANFEMDDFEVRTPTDILGQHIHLVKFDVTSSDGAANGWNYEDGTFSPEDVRQTIEASNKAGGIWRDGRQQPCQQDGDSFSGPGCLEPKTVPYFGPGPEGDWVGAQTTVQRWYADPLLDNRGDDRTIRSVFTHDHFSPSTHQQVGFYAGLLVEPADSKWRDPVTGALMGGRVIQGPITGSGPAVSTNDGGPTGWAADIITADPAMSYREFALEFQDAQFAYTNGSQSRLKKYQRYPGGIQNIPGGIMGWASPGNSISAPVDNMSANLGFDRGKPPWPHLITNLFATGVQSVNYRSEPLPLRLAPASGNQFVNPVQTDLADAFRSIERADPAFNRQPDSQIPIQPWKSSGVCDVTVENSTQLDGFCFANPFPGALPTDPYTPLMRAYEGDSVQVRVLVGAHMAPHSLNFQGVQWLFEPKFKNSGYRSTQGMGISEHYEFLFEMPRTASGNDTADYLYMPDSSPLGLEDGDWGLIRAYKKELPSTGCADRPAEEACLQPLPNNPRPWAVSGGGNGCPEGAPARILNVTATTSQQAIGGPIPFNDQSPQKVELQDGLMYVRSEDLDASGKLKDGVPIEPLVLRAAAGECLVVTLTNALPPPEQDLNAGLQLGSLNSSGNITQYGPVLTLTAKDQEEMDKWVFFLNERSYNTSFRIAFNQQAPPGVALPEDPNAPDMAYEVFQPGRWWGIFQGTPGFSVSKIDARRIQVAIPITLQTSHQVGLHAQLGSFDVGDSNGVNVGLNRVQTVPPGQQRTYTWYAGLVKSELEGSQALVTREISVSGSQQEVDRMAFFLNMRSYNTVFQSRFNRNPYGLFLPDNPSSPGMSYRVDTPNQAWTIFQQVSADYTQVYSVRKASATRLDIRAEVPEEATLRMAYTPVEFGSVNLTPADPLYQHPFGLIGALIIEPERSTWREDSNSRASATVYPAEGEPYREFVLVYQDDAQTNAAGGQGFNYRVEPLANRGVDDSQAAPQNAPNGIVAATSDTQILADPVTPIFSAAVDQQVRFRLLHPAGADDNAVTIHGHMWQEEPYADGSTRIGFNPLSQWLGQRPSFGPNASFEALIGKAGGEFEVPGDYLYRVYVINQYPQGAWGLMRVGYPDEDVVTITRFQPLEGGADQIVVAGTNTVNTSSGLMADSVTIFSGTGNDLREIAQVPVDRLSGRWEFTSEIGVSPASVTVTSPGGGSMEAPRYIDQASEGGPPTETEYDRNYYRFRKKINVPVKTGPQQQRQ